MLDFLFARLTAGEERGGKAFDAVTRIAREPGFYRECKVPDTVDGRFAVLATVLALLLARIECDGEAGGALSAAITERFIAVMEAEHREFGLGDPALGKTVRKLVGSLGRRLDLWREATASGWDEATRQSLYGIEADPGAVASAAVRLRAISDGFDKATLDEIAKGQII